MAVPILELVLCLRDRCPLFFRRVGGSLEFTENNAPKDVGVPYCWVVPIATTAGEINQTQGYQSRVATFAFIVCVDGKAHKADGDASRAAATVDGFTAHFSAIESALLGWKPLGFFWDFVPTFVREVPLGSDNVRSYMLMEYDLPYREYNFAYLGQGAASVEEWEIAHPNYKALNVKELVIHYNGTAGEFPTVDDGDFAIHIPIPEPSEQTIANKIELSSVENQEAAVASVLSVPRDREAAVASAVLSVKTKDAPQPTTVTVYLSSPDGGYILVSPTGEIPRMLAHLIYSNRSYPGHGITTYTTNG